MAAFVKKGIKKKCQETPLNISIISVSYDIFIRGNNVMPRKK